MLLSSGMRQHTNMKFLKFLYLSFREAAIMFFSSPTTKMGGGGEKAGKETSEEKRRPLSWRGEGDALVARTLKKNIFVASLW